MKYNIINLSLIGLLGFTSSCSSPAKPTISEEKAILVSSNTASTGSSENFISGSGKIEAENSANISTRMMGYVTSIAVKTGQQVQKGQLLASISNTDLRAKKAQAEAGISQAMSAYQSARKDYERFQTLYEQKSASQKELEDMTTRFEMSKAGLEAAKQMRNELMAQFAYSNITAPFSGVVTGTFLKEGDMANPGMPILSMEGTSKLQGVVMVSENEIHSIKNGMSAQVNIKSLNRTISGKVIELSQSATNTAGQYLVKINLDKTDEILAGMFINVLFPVKHDSQNQESDVLLIPQEAIVNQGQLRGVYVISAQNQALLRWLRLGKTYNNQVEVLSGLRSDERYVVKADGRLYNGSAVRTQ